ncbi:MAG: hypothetical protein AB8G17_05340 [Gammaproteobacteria bacterium]
MNSIKNAVTIQTEARVLFQRMLTAALILIPTSSLAADFGHCMRDQSGVCLLFARIPVASGGSGTEEILVYDKGKWILNDQVLMEYGTERSHPIVGDWNQDGYDEPGVYEDGEFRFGVWPGGDTEEQHSLVFGAHGAIPVAGRWNTDGTDSIGVYHDGQFELLTDFRTPAPPIIVAFHSSWPLFLEPVVGPLDGTINQVGVRRGNSFIYAAQNVPGNYNFDWPQSTQLASRTVVPPGPNYALAVLPMSTQNVADASYRLAFVRTRSPQSFDGIGCISGMPGCTTSDDPNEFATPINPYDSDVIIVGDDY